jgi:hypothetical protein
VSDAKTRIYFGQFRGTSASEGEYRRAPQIEWGGIAAKYWQIPVEIEIGIV